MRFEYEIVRLDGLLPVPRAEQVAFAEAATCNVCGQASLAPIAELNNSLVTSQCQDCGHVFHSGSPTRDWFQPVLPVHKLGSTTTDMVHAAHSLSLINMRHSLLEVKLSGNIKRNAARGPAT